MTVMRRTLISSLVALPLFAAAGCGGTSKSSVADTSTTTGVPSTVTTSTLALLPPVGSSLTAQHVRTLVASGKTSRYRVSMAFTPLAVRPLRTTQLLVNDPPRRLNRVDNTFLVVLSRTEGAVCSNPGGSWVCRESTPTLTDFYNKLTDEAVRNVSNIVRAPDLTLVGRRATCFTFNKQESGKTSTNLWCFDQQTGAPLRMQRTLPGYPTTGAEATAFGQPTDADFALPAPITK